MLMLFMGLTVAHCSVTFFTLLSLSRSTLAGGRAVSNAPVILQTFVAFPVQEGIVPYTYNNRSFTSLIVDNESINKAFN